MTDFDQGALDALIDQAEHEKKWLWSRYQDLWFSPSELRQKNNEGWFRWGAVNWELRDPAERLAEYDVQIARVQLERQKFLERT